METGLLAALWSRLPCQCGGAVVRVLGRRPAGSSRAEQAAELLDDLAGRACGRAWEPRAGHAGTVDKLGPGEGG